MKTPPKQGFDSIWVLLKSTREYYPLVLIYSICISLLTLATPISVQSLVNTFSFGPYFQPLFILSVLLLGLLGVLGFLKSMQYLLVEYLQRKIYAKVTTQISNTYLSKAEKSQKDVFLANRYFDVLTIQKTLAYLVTDGTAVALQTIIGLFLISLYHPFFILFSLLITMSLFFPIWFFGGRAMEAASKESTSKYDVAEFLESIAFQDMEATKKDADKKVSSFLAFRDKHFKILFVQNIIYAILFAILNATLLGLGGYLVIKNQLTVGQLVATEIIVNAILSHFLYAKKYLESFYDLYAAAEKVNTFYQTSGQELINDKDYPSIRSIYTPLSYRKIFKWFTLGAATLSLFVFFTPWLQTSRAAGRVTALSPNDRIQLITSTVSGRIEEWLIKDGQEVKKGDPIVRVVDNDPDFLKRLEAQRDASIQKFEAAKEASDTARLNFHRQEKLVQEGLSSPKDFEKAKINYKKLLAEEAKAVAELTTSEVKLSRQQLQLITAPKDGRVLRVLHGSGSVNIKQGDGLVKFVPETDQSAVELFIDGNDLPLIFEGRKVRIQFEGWPSVQFSGWPSIAVGSFGGLVSVVDPSVSENGTFRILVSPDPSDPNPWPDQRFLRQGSRAVGLVLLDQVSIGYEIWRKVNGFPESMESVPAPDEKGSKK